MAIVPPNQGRITIRPYNVVFYIVEQHPGRPIYFGHWHKLEGPGRPGVRPLRKHTLQGTKEPIPQKGDRGPMRAPV